MKIITWNCNMAFRKKAGLILRHHPDILVVPECEHPSKLLFGEGIPTPTQSLWFGNNQHKGLGIFSYGTWRLKAMRNHNPALKMIIPVAVTGGHYTFTLYAVWANNPDDPEGQYVEQVWKAIHHYDKKLTNNKTLLIGDFNSNTIWDRKYRAGNHSNVVKRLGEKGIVSCYHLAHQQTQGKEYHPTFYLYRHKDKPYHLDYCFASADMANNIQSVEIGDYDYWSAFSDHVPVMVTFNEQLRDNMRKQSAIDTSAAREKNRLTRKKSAIITSAIRDTSRTDMQTQSAIITSAIRDNDKTDMQQKSPITTSDIRDNDRTDTQTQSAIITSAIRDNDRTDTQTQSAIITSAIRDKTH